MTSFQHEVIRLLVKKGVLGSTRKEVTQALIQKGIEWLVDSEYVRKHDESLKQLRSLTAERRSKK